MEDKKQYAELETTRIKYKIGDVFRLMYKGEVHVDYYLLSQVNPFEIALISLDGGNRANNPVKVKDAYNVTQDEFKEIAGAFFPNHQLMDKSIIFKFPK